MKNFLKIFNYSTIVFVVSSVNLFAQNPVSSSPSSDRPTNQNNQANFQEMNQKRKGRCDFCKKIKNDVRMECDWLGLNPMSCKQCHLKYGIKEGV
jgi:hypothetical protein